MSVQVCDGTVGRFIRLTRTRVMASQLCVRIVRERRRQLQASQELHCLII